MIPLKKLPLVSTLALLTALAPAKGAVVATYDFPTTAGTTLPSASTDSDSNSTAGSLGIGAGFTGGISSISGNPVNSLFVSGANNTTEANAFIGNKFITLTVTPVSGPLSFSSLNFDYRRDLSSSGGNFALYASTTGSFTSGNNIASGLLANVSPTVFSSQSIDLSAISSVQSVSSAITFRLYLWGATLSTSNTRFDNIALTAVPEPGTWGLLCLGGAFLVLLRRKKA